MEIGSEYLLDAVERALAEDIGTGDVTTSAIISDRKKGRAKIIARRDGIISGLDLAALVFYKLDPETEFATELIEGSTVKANEQLITIKSSLSALLSGERTALNFLMYLSGIATLTALFCRAVAGTECKILDTRKTTPGARPLEKRSVASGGGHNHRSGLFDMVLIKENHIAAAGSIKTAVAQAVNYVKELGNERIRIEVETQNQSQVEIVTGLPVDRIMLDNFSIAETKKAVVHIRKNNPALEIEASGNITLDNVAEYAKTGIDFISVGAITHSAPWLDLSMLVEAS